MNPADHARRGFLRGLGVASLAGLAAPLASAHAAADAAGTTEYLLPPGVIHLNTASLGATPRVVLERTLEAWRRIESHPVRMVYGKAGDSVLMSVEAVRVQAAAFLGCETDELLLSRCTTDGMNAIAQGMRWRAGDRVLSTDQEHHGGSECWSYQAERRGVAIDRVAIAPDAHDPAAILQRFADALTPRTRVISVSHVLSATGLRMPVAELSKLARERGAMCVVDGAQAVGAFPVDVKALGCHAYATSGHKWLMGPKGTGLLYVAREAWDAIKPIQWQQDHHYGAESAGVGPQALAIGLGAAIERLQQSGMERVAAHGIALRTRAYDGLKEIARVRVLGAPPGPQATAIVACALPQEVDSLALLNALYDKHRIVVKRAEARWFNGIRLSPHVLNDEAHIDAALSALRAELS